MSQQLTQLCIDACRGKVQAYAGDNAQYTDDAVRAAIQEMIGSETLTYQAYRKHKHELFELLEEVLNIRLPDAWNISPFYNELVSLKSTQLGDKNEFIVEDNSTLIVSRFSGNHWNVERQKLIGKRAFNLPCEWYAVRCYDELERFLVGASSVAEMFNKLVESFQKAIDARVYTSFTAAPTYLPGAFVENGALTIDAVMNLIARVETANGNKAARLVGSRAALAKLDGLIPSEWISDSQKEQKASTGQLRIWQGIPTVVIPQVFVASSYDFAISDKTIMVIPADYKPVLLWYEGDTRTRELDDHMTNDMTIDLTLQSKIGCGVVFSELFGIYNIV